MWPFMFPFKRRKEPPTLTKTELLDRIHEELETVRQFIERLELAEKDIVNLNTALNRVERKQSRWVEIMNEREDPARVAKFLETQPGSVQTMPQCGEETE